MRIALNARFLLEGKMEGIGYSSWEFYRRIIELNPRHTFILFFDRPFSSGFSSFKNVIPVSLFPPARHPFLWMIWFELVLPAALRKWKVDVFFSHDGFSSLRTSVPVYVTVHDLAFLAYPKQIPFLVYLFYRIFTPQYLKKAVHIFTVSNFVREDIQKKYGVPESGITVIPNGYRALLKQAEESEGEPVLPAHPYFFYYGAIHPRKNIDRVIKAFDLFRSQNEGKVSFVIAGRRAWKTGSVERAWRKSTFKEDIRFVGYVSDAAISYYLKNALALVYVSLHEGFGMPIVEAFAANTPVITSCEGALAETSGDAALKVNPRDIVAIAQGMRELYGNPSLRAALTMAGERALSRFNWDDSAKICSRIIIGEKFEDGLLTKPKPF